MRGPAGRNRKTGLGGPSFPKTWGSGCCIRKSRIQVGESSEKCRVSCFPRPWLGRRRGARVEVSPPPSHQCADRYPRKFHDDRDNLAQRAPGDKSNSTGGFVTNRMLGQRLLAPLPGCCYVRRARNERQLGRRRRGWAAPEPGPRLNEQLRPPPPSVEGDGRKLRLAGHFSPRGSDWRRPWAELLVGQRRRRSPPQLPVYTPH